MKTTKAFILMLFVITVPFTLIEVSTEASVGVNIGDWAKYNIMAGWSPQDANMSTTWEDLKNTKWENLTVQKISGTNITILVTQFINETQKNVVIWKDIATQQGNLLLTKELLLYQFQIIPAGLDVDAAIPGTALRINKTRLEEFAGQKRQVNYVGISFREFMGETIYEYYWDKETGILCASRTLDTDYERGTQALLQKQITETSLWQAQTSSSQDSQQTWVQWGPPLVIGTTVVVILLIIKTRPKTKRTRRKRI